MVSGVNGISHLYNIEDVSEISLFSITLIGAFSGCDAGGARATVEGTLTLPGAATFTYYVRVENDTYAVVPYSGTVVFDITFSH